MENKKKYYEALKENKGHLNEIDLGERMGLDEDKTRKIIAHLLSENVLEFDENKNCNYKIITSRKRKMNSR